MQLYLLFLPEYTEEIGSTFLLRKSFHKVWIELNILPASCPHKLRSGNTTPASPNQIISLLWPQPLDEEWLDGLGWTSQSAP